MSGLERLINPQSYTTDSNDLSSDSDSTSKNLDDNSKMLNSSSYENTTSEILAERTTGNLTGPKGVIADYRYTRRKLTFNKSQPKPMTMPKALSEETVSKDYNELSDADDQQFFEAYRKKRLQELASRTKNTNPREIFGEVYQLDFDTYNQAIDRVDKDVTIIVHLYELHIGLCQELHSILKELAGIYKYAKFCEIPASLTHSKFDDVVLPTVLVYRDKKLVNNLVRFIDEVLAPDFTYHSVESIFLRLGILNESQRY